MRYLTAVRTKASYVAACMALLVTPGISSGQTAAPTLGTTSTYGVYSGEGAIENTGLTRITGDIGTNAGAFTGFPPGIYSGAKHVADPQALVAKNDLTVAWNQAGLIPCDTTLSVTMGNGQTLTPRAYCVGPASTITGDLTFDAKGDPNAVFVVRVNGALNAATGVRIILANGAQAVNIYWRVDGAVSILDNSSFKGTILANGAVHLYGGSTLEGRALALVGAVTMASNIIAVPVNGAAPANTLIVVRPGPGDSVKGGTSNYQITWGGTGIDAKKTFEYSLDNGATWTRIGDLDADVYAYGWNVPDTVSNQALVRITDRNNLSGTSGVFTITSSKPNQGTIVIVTPAAGDTVTGGTQNYQITWTGSGIDSRKAFEYSLDGGVTWTAIGTMDADAFSYGWNVPDTASPTAMIRITDSKGAVGRSGIFIIKSGKPNPGSIIVVRPAAGEVIAGGTEDYQITWSGSNIAATKTFEYSLDGGSTWNFIGMATATQLTYTWADVPNIATTQGLIRISDANGASGTSGMFTITQTAGVGSINSLTLSGLDTKRNIGNNQNLGISWTFTPDIGAWVEVEYSLDNMLTWIHLATVPTNETPGTSWMTTAAGYHDRVVIRITGSKGMTRTSEPFSIGAPLAGVPTAQRKNGYSLTNYPSPASGQTTILFALPVGGDVTLTISDGLGREVAGLLSRRVEAGTHSIPFDASRLAEGVYYYTLRAGSTMLVGSMIVVK